MTPSSHINPRLVKLSEQAMSSSTDSKGGKKKREIDVLIEARSKEMEFRMEIEKLKEEREMAREKARDERERAREERERERKRKGG